MLKFANAMLHPSDSMRASVDLAWQEQQKAIAATDDQWDWDGWLPEMGTLVSTTVRLADILGLVH
ncbi:MAG: hypothetical protein U0930_17860 [Pirellulales bacterium]